MNNNVNQYKGAYFRYFYFNLKARKGNNVTTYCYKCDEFLEMLYKRLVMFDKISHIEFIKVILKAYRGQIVKFNGVNYQYELSSKKMSRYATPMTTINDYDTFFSIIVDYINEVEGGVYYD